MKRESGSVSTDALVGVSYEPAFPMQFPKLRLYICIDEESMRNADLLWCIYFFPLSFPEL